MAKAFGPGYDRVAEIFSQLLIIHYWEGLRYLTEIYPRQRQAMHINTNTEMDCVVSKL